MPITPLRKKLFLAGLRQHGNVRRAANEASPGRRDCRATFHVHRREDAAFQRAWTRALNHEERLAALLA